MRNVEEVEHELDTSKKSTDGNGSIPATFSIMDAPTFVKAERA